MGWLDQFEGASSILNIERAKAAHTAIAASDSNLATGSSVESCSLTWRSTAYTGPQEPL